MKNAHDIAIELENIVGKLFDHDFDHSGTIFSADYIEIESFYEVIALVLFVAAKHDYFDFINDLHKYKRVNMNKIPNVEVRFDKFKSLIKIKE